MDEKFRKLIELGAGDFEQADAELIAHLEGTCCLLKEWHAPVELQHAGLYHVAYGTSLIADSLLKISQRQEVIAVIGEQPENIVYHYFACQTPAFFGQFGNVKHPKFYDRLTNKPSDISLELLAQLCELIAAKEIDLALYHPKYTAKQTNHLIELFSRMEAFLSSSARRKIAYVFDSKA